MSGKRHSDKEASSQNKCFRERCSLGGKEEKTDGRRIRWPCGWWSGEDLAFELKHESDMGAAACVTGTSLAC